ncbi:hypothetical protein YC2023_116014 [Brassica napus]
MSITSPALFISGVRIASHLETSQRGWPLYRFPQSNRDVEEDEERSYNVEEINEKASSVHGYVVFETEQSAEASLAHNMPLIDGNHVHLVRS